MGLHLTAKTGRPGRLDDLLDVPVGVGKKFPVVRIESRRQVWRVEVEDGPADDLVPGPAQRRREGLITAQVTQIGVLVVNRHGDRLEELLEEVRSLSGTRLSRLLVGDILAGSYYPHRLTIAVEECLGALADAANLPVRSNDAVLQLGGTCGKGPGDRLLNEEPILGMHQGEERLESTPHLSGTVP